MRTRSSLWLVGLVLLVALGVPSRAAADPVGLITEFSSGLPANSFPEFIAPGADGNLWFTDEGSTKAIGRISPQTGQITEFSSGLNGGPYGIAPGADGNLWFTVEASTPAVGRVGASAPAALQAAPSGAGAGRVGSPESCQNASFATWAGASPSLTLYSFDGYRWLRDGAQIAGQTAQTYTPATADVGHRLACQVTVTYPMPFLVTPATATSTAITVAPAPPPRPVASGLALSPRTFSLAGRKVKGRCVKLTGTNKRAKPCQRALELTIAYTLNTAATVTFTLELKASGRTVGGSCVKPTNKNKRHKRCTRLEGLPGAITQTGKAGTNTFTFTGNFAGHKLGPGTYVLTAAPAGGTSQQITFTLTS